ncbi:RNA polymerase sigma factor [Microbacterium resistens]|uniref:RNA polymerase sigma factor n=1 Tax=Microbacterium resistens TaxID=156977 RepID=UPI00366EEEF3
MGLHRIPDVTFRADPATTRSVGFEITGSRLPRPASAAVARAFEDLFRAYHAVIVTAGFNRLDDLGAAEDAAAEVFTAAWRRRSEHETVFTLPWLYTTLRNVTGSEYRRRGRASRRYQRLAAEAPGHPTVLIDDDAIAVRQAVARMRSDDREVIWMAYWEELSREEMAEILGCSVAAVKVRLHRARERLRRRLGADETAGEGPVEERKGVHDGR